MTVDVIDRAEAIDALFAGGSCQLVDQAGDPRPMALRRRDRRRHRSRLRPRAPARRPDDPADLADLGGLPERTHRLPIACVEGWSLNATWTGVAVADLLALVGADPASIVRVRSMQTRGAFSASELPTDFAADPRTMLALELNGEPLDLDHGYPCRIMAPNRPGVLQTR